MYAPEEDGAIVREFFIVRCTVSMFTVSFESCYHVIFRYSVKTGEGLKEVS